MSRRQYKSPLFRLIENRRLEGKPLLLKSLIIISPTILIVLYLVIKNWKAFLLVPPINIFFLLLAGLWVVIGPILIMLHYRRTDKFLEKVNVDLCQAHYEKRHEPCINRSAIEPQNNVSTEYKCEIIAFKRNFYSHQKAITIIVNFIWCLLVLIAISENKSALIVTGIDSTDATLYYPFLFFILYVGYLTSFGLSQTLTMLWSVRSICKLKLLRYDPVECDDEFNLSFIGNYSIMTARLLSSGILLLPMLFLFTSNANNNYATSLPLIILYTLILLISIVVPLSLVFNYSRNERESAINNLQKNLIESIRLSYQEPSIQNELKCATIQRELELVKNQKIVLMTATDVGTALITIGTPFIAQVFLSSDFFMLILKLLKVID